MPETKEHDSALTFMSALSEERCSGSRGRPEMLTMCAQLNRNFILQTGNCSLWALKWGPKCTPQLDEGIIAGNFSCPVGEGSIRLWELLNPTLSRSLESFSVPPKYLTANRLQNMNPCVDAVLCPCESGQVNLFSFFIIRCLSPTALVLPYRVTPKSHCMKCRKP